MAKEERYTISVQVDVTVLASTEREAKTLVFEAIQRAAHSVAVNDEVTVELTGIEYQNEHGEMVCHDLR